MWKLTRKIFLFLLFFLLLFFALLIAVNGIKSSPSAANVWLSQAPANPYADSDNLFLARAAIDIPEMDNRLTEAKNRILQKTQWDEAKAYGKLTPQQVAAGEPQFAVINFVKSIEWCNPVKRPCLDAIEKQHTSIQTSQSANRLLLQRYLELPQFKGAYDTTPANLYAPYFPSKTHNIRLLFLAHVGDRFLHGTDQNRANALKELASDIGVWKKSIADHSSLIDKMVASIALHQSLALAGEIINHPRFDAQRDADLLEAALQEDTVPDFSMVWGHEFRFGHQSLNNITAQGLYEDSALFFEKDYAASSSLQQLAGKALLWFFDPVDTQNRRADFFMQLMDASKRPPSQSLQAQKALLAQVADSSGFGWGLLRNPVGKTIHNAFTPDFTIYSQRIYDVFAYQKLVRLAYQWRKQQLTPDARSAQLAANHTQAQHPASQVPFTYDTATHTLQMKALQPKDGHRYDVVVFTPLP